MDTSSILAPVLAPATTAIELPKTIKIGWSVYTVGDWPETDARDASRVGEADHAKLRIKICDNMPCTKRAEILLHEILHTLLIFFNVDLKEMVKANEPNEQLTMQMGNGLAMIIADNPDLRRYLDEVWPRFDVSSNDH